MKPFSATSLFLGLALSVSALTAQAQQPALAPGEQMRPAVADMKSLIEQGRFSDAFNLGLKNDSLAGDPIYDYYFGIAAVDSGRASLGVLALERVLLSNPGNDLARLELARGYFVLEDYERAREEFQILAAKDLPPAVKASIGKYLGAIREKDPEFRTVSKAYVEWGIGSNSNVNSSTDQAVLFPFPDVSSPSGVGLIPILPDPARSSALSQLVVGASISGPVVPGIKYGLGIDLSQKQFASVDNFDQTVGSINASLEYSGESSIYRLGTYAQQARLDGDKLRDTYGLVVEYVKPIDKDTSVRAGLGFSQLRYAGTNENRDADLPTFAIGYGTFLGGAWKWGFDLSANLGREKNLKDRPDFGRDIYGLRVIFGFSPSPGWQGAWTYSYTHSKYDGPDSAAINTIKTEDLHTLEFGLQYQLTKGWSVRGELGYTKNDSNITLYSYNQRTTFLKMRYEWK